MLQQPSGIGPKLKKLEGFFPGGEHEELEFQKSRSSLPEGVFWKILHNLQENNCARVSFLIDLRN